MEWAFKTLRKMMGGKPPAKGEEILTFWLSYLSTTIPQRLLENVLQREVPGWQPCSRHRGCRMRMVDSRWHVTGEGPKGTEFLPGLTMWKTVSRDKVWEDLAIAPNKTKLLKQTTSQLKQKWEVTEEKKCNRCKVFAPPWPLSTQSLQWKHRVWIYPQTEM